MLEVSCRDLGLAQCSFVASASSLWKLEYTILVHARDEHPELVADITMEQHDALLRQIAAAAHEVAVQ